MSPTNRPAFAPWDVRDVPRTIDAEDAARRARIFADIESRLAALLEKAAASGDSAHAQAILQRHARHHAWHAQLWNDALVDGGASKGDAGHDPVVAEFLSALEAAAGGSFIELLAGIYRVLIPRKVAAYTYYLRAIGSSGQDSDSRWLEFILKDEFDGIRDGELLLQSLLSTKEDVELAASARAKLEALLVKSGGIAGIGTLGATGAQEVKVS